jgi:hypothetical protein
MKDLNGKEKDSWIKSTFPILSAEAPFVRPWASIINEPFAYLASDPICGVRAEHSNDEFEDRQYNFYSRACHSNK